MEFDDMRPELLRAIHESPDNKVVRIALLHLYVLAVRGSNAIQLLHNTINELPLEDRQTIYRAMYNAQKIFAVKE